MVGDDYGDQTVAVLPWGTCGPAEPLPPGGMDTPLPGEITDAVVLIAGPSTFSWVRGGFPEQATLEEEDLA